VPIFFAMKQNAKYITYSGILAALYAGLCYLQNALLPGSASWVIQFRAAEALCALAFFTPAAVPGLTIGCFLFNLSFSGSLPLDLLVGTLATFLSVGGMYLCRKTRWKLWTLSFPVIANAILVGWELAIYVGGGFWLNAFYVAVGEAAVMFTLGLFLYEALKKIRFS